MMQIASLISEDDFMARFNTSIPTDDFIDRLDDFLSFWHYDSQPIYQTYARYMKANWSESYEVNLTQVLYRTGFCDTFNFPNASQFFNMDT